MQIKKCQWINKPENVKIISSRSIFFKSESEHGLFHTFSEEGKLALSWEASDNVNIYVVYLNTDVENISFAFEENQIKKFLTIQNIKTIDIYPITSCKEMEIQKKDDTLSFLVEGKEISTFKRSNIKASISLGLAAKGQGKVSFNFVFSPF